MEEARRMIPVAEPLIGARELEYVTDAVRSGWVSSIGRYVTEFERAVAEACAADHAVATSSGTAALHLALAVLGIGPGDEVIVPSLTFVATANAVRYVGATPVFADSDPDHWCIDAAEVQRLVTARTRAVIPVHLYGHPADMDAIMAIARKHRLKVIEDAAEALGATYRGRPVTALGDAGVLSFYGNKLITTGEGGMLVTNNPRVAERARLLRDHAMHPERRYWHEEVGFNFRITNLQAALGLAQAERIGAFLARKREIAERYRDALADVPGIRMQCEARWAGSAWWMSSVQVESGFGLERDALMQALERSGIDTRGSFVPVHTMPPYRHGRVLHHAQRLARNVLSLPSAVTLTHEDQDYVIARVRSLSAAPSRKLAARRIEAEDAAIETPGEQREAA